MSEFKIPKKLIEVALPLDIINSSAAQDKGNPFLKGHPRSLHQWWARRPLLAARAVIFAQMVNDPGYERSLGRGVNKESAHAERARLFKLIERLTQWENINSNEVLGEALSEIKKSWRETCDLNKGHPKAKDLFNPDKLPKFHDPFSGGGAIPLEAMRLGLESHASDLNPVAVTINKAMIEIPARFCGTKPVGPAEAKNQSLFQEWPGNSGLAEDVRRYARWIRERAAERFEQNYPSIEISKELSKMQPELRPYVGEKLKVATWLWAKTVKSPNPAYAHVEVPLVSTFTLFSKGEKHVFVEPIIEGDKYLFVVKNGDASGAKRASAGTKLGRNGFRCAISGSPISLEYIREEAKAGRIGTRLMAIVAERKGTSGRIYVSPTDTHEKIAKQVSPSWKPNVEFFSEALGFRIGNYGMKRWGDLYTSRQLHSLSMLSDLVIECREKSYADAVASSMSCDGRSLAEGGSGAKAYSEAISTYLSLAVDKFADYCNTLCTWNPTNQNVGHLFTKQTISMAWDFPEASPIVGGLAIDSIAEGITKSLEYLPSRGSGYAHQKDAGEPSEYTRQAVVSTDPPYYDNIGYADLSDFFYVWLKRSLGDIFPNLFDGNTTPKAEELVATPARHGGMQAAESFFLDGMTKVMRHISQESHPAFPITIYYGFKQSETESEGTSSTGWETFLDAVVRAGFSITGTWPMRTEREARARGQKSNALASSIVLVCKKRDSSSSTVSRRDFVRELNSALPEALLEMTTGQEHSPVAPVDLSQAIIGPGMAIYSKYSAVLEADGRPMSVKAALQLINRFLAEDDFDHDTQFCLQWFDQHGWDTGKFGEADVLARAKGTSVDGLREGRVVESSSGTLRLLKPSDLSTAWKPEADSRISIWELLHQMIARFYSGGESSAGELLAKANSYSEAIRTLAYRLYTICERKGWAQDASSYDGLVRAWDSIESAARATGYSGTQIALFDSATSSDESHNTTKAKSRKKK